MSNIHTLVRGQRRLKLAELNGTITIPAQVANWSARVVNNGGPKPSEKTIMILSEFYQGLIDNNLLSKMVAVNCFVPDSISASITPLIVGPGQDPWTNTNFAPGDLSIKGLAGNGSNKYLNSGINPYYVFTDTSAGMTTYISNNPSPASNALDGVAPGGGSTYYMNGCYANLQLWHCWNNSAGQGNASCPAPQPTGYTSGNRTAANHSAIYFASSTFAHTQSVLIKTNGGSRPNDVAWVFANKVEGSAQFPHTHTLSFHAFHQGLLENESVIFYNLIQQMRMSLGGGYV